MYVGSPLKAASTEQGTTTFRAANGFAIAVNEPLLAAALNYLAEVWPAWVNFDTLVEAGRSALSNQGQSLSEEKLATRRTELATFLLGCFAERAVELHVAAPPFSVVPSKRPTASPLARRQALTSPLVTNLRHDLVRLSAAARELLPRLAEHGDSAEFARGTANYESAIREIARGALLMR